MAIRDYDYEPQLSHCISEGCFLELTLKKMEGNDFNLVWTYEGLEDLFSEMYIDSIFALEEDSRWEYSTAIPIRKITGSITFQMSHE